MDEPASALDPLATSKIEDLILELKKDYTIVIVTHNMQQAARMSDFTAFFYLATWWNSTRLGRFSPAGEETDGRLCDRTVWLKADGATKLKLWNISTWSWTC